ncbi:cysteine hydrolase family protein [Paenibacillus puldeungensis]|uniref:Cysteine hydrolase family protein n=1 Tax=Paenibacillus puldeungensis TaxID=696536 RepID=A0ABW3RTG5_9BACL
MKPALLIIDMQQGLLTSPHAQAKIPGACEVINYVADLFRKAGRPVVIVQDLESGGSEDSPDFAVIPEIRIDETDLRITKEWSNAFWKTNLEQILREQDTDFVIACGFAAEYCVTFSFNGARERGFKAAILQHGIIGEHPDAVAGVIRDRNIISYPVIEAVLKN